ncbi:unnamed protein product [Cunninghamella echinulata]
MEMGWLETDVESYEVKIKEQGSRILQVELENKNLSIELSQHQEENKQMLKLIEQLQDEMRRLRR